MLAYYTMLETRDFYKRKDYMESLESIGVGGDSFHNLFKNN